jgi:hypothetical protein
MKLPRLFLFCLAAVIDQSPGWALPASIVRVEEPTGIYARTNEVVPVPYDRIGGKQAGWQIVDPQGRELPWQTTDNVLLFPATLIPGELPEYQITAGTDANTNFASQLRLRTIGLNRVELGNRFFRILIEKKTAAIVEAFNLSAEAHHTLNLVETTPEDLAALKDDIHAAEAMGFKPVPGVPEGNIGWTTLGGEGPIMEVDFPETGPLRAKARLTRTNEIWEFLWTAESRALLWQILRKPATASVGPESKTGFRFTAVSASPFLPFDRCVNGSEYDWPNGPDDPEPPDHDIAPRQWPRLPGNHAVYYCNADNYGALGIVALDTNLNWIGIGSRRFIAEKEPARPNPAAKVVQSKPWTICTELALTFPQWRGSNTVLEARREFRILRQPLLVQISKDAPKLKHSTSTNNASVLLPLPAGEGRGEGNGNTNDQPSKKEGRRGAAGLPTTCRRPPPGEEGDAAGCLGLKRA